MSDAGLLERNPRSSRTQRDADAASAARHASALARADGCLLCGSRRFLRTTASYEVICRSCERELGIAPPRKGGRRVRVLE